MCDGDNVKQRNGSGFWSCLCHLLYCVWHSLVASLSLSFHGCFRWFLGFSSRWHNSVGLSGFSPVTATSVVDICHTLPQSMAKCLSWGVGNEGSLRGEMPSSFWICSPVIYDLTRDKLTSISWIPAGGPVCFCERSTEVNFGFDSNFWSRPYHLPTGSPWLNFLKCRNVYYLG